MTVIYIIGLVVALYAIYLYAFCAYKKDIIGDPTSERLLFPRITYLLCLGLAFVPMANLIFGLTALLFPLFIRNEIYFDSWLLKTPGEDRKKETEEET